MQLSPPELWTPIYTITMTIETCSSSAPDLAQNVRLRWTIRLAKGWVTRRVQLWLSITLAAGSSG